MTSRGYHVNRHPRRHINSSNINPTTSRKISSSHRESTRESNSKFSNSSSYLADDENYPQFKTQLAKLGLELRDITPDGNCLFSALADQLEGSPSNHEYHRKSVCDYIILHRKDFEPFMEDDVPFETHMEELRQLGTYGGNEVIVAFCRLHKVTVVIHQLYRDPWQICGTEQARTEAHFQNRRQLHIAYHNGDHYSSVRKIGDTSDSPTNIRIPFDASNAHNSSGGSHCGVMNSHQYASSSSCGRQFSKVNNRTEVDRIRHHFNGYFTNDDVMKAYEDFGCDEDATISYLMQLQETEASYEEEKVNGLYASRNHSYASNNSNCNGNSSLWAPQGTGTRIFGCSAVPLKSSNTVRSRPPRMYAKQQKKDRATERRRHERLAFTGIEGDHTGSSRMRGKTQEEEYIIQGVHAIQI